MNVDYCLTKNISLFSKVMSHKSWLTQHEKNDFDSSSFPNTSKSVMFLSLSIFQKFCRKQFFDVKTSDAEIRGLIYQLLYYIDKNALFFF